MEAIDTTFPNNPPDEPHSALYLAAQDGDLARVQALVPREEPLLHRGPITLQRLACINHARRWTELDYRMSGFVNEYSWFDRTPLLIAIFRGHAPVVKYLLEQGADPTLRACPRDNQVLNALQEAKQACQRASQLRRQQEGIHGHVSNAQQVRRKRIYIRNMVQTALEFWGISMDASPHANRNRIFGMPRDSQSMVEALRELDPYPEPTLDNDDNNETPHDNEHVAHNIQEGTQQDGALEEEEEALSEGQQEARQRRREETERILQEYADARQRAAARREQEREEQRPPSTNINHPTLEYQPRACRFFAQGRCRFGRRCRFGHEISVPSQRQRRQQRSREDSQSPGRINDPIVTVGEGDEPVLSFDPAYDDEDWDSLWT